MASRLEDYALVGDMQTAALVGRDGSVDWLCLPRFDSPACFAALLGTADNGFWRLAPRSGGAATRRHYEADSLVLVSEWDTPDGGVRVLDFMPPRDQAADLVRIVEGVSGAVPVRSELRLRFDYGRSVPWVQRSDGHLVGIAGPDAVALATPAATYGRELTTYADLTVRPGEQVPFVLTWSPSYQPPPTPTDPFRALADTRAFWREWVGHCTYRGRWRDAVMRSLLTLKALTYAPTGGIVAAATTSLPEDLGGVRNWDYRFCWLRDSTFTLEALLRSGYLAEARAWREWLLRAIAGSPEQVQTLYGVAGERSAVEFELPWLAGYEGSRPVRVGNDAVGQLQLDVYGEVLDCLHLARRAGVGSDPRSWRLQRALLDWLESNWDTPDEGIWEVRGPRRHFTHSKVMAWVGLDRAVKAVEHFGREGPVRRWREVRDRIHRDVCTRGYDPDRNTFVQYYGSTDVDAALLLIPQVGFLPPEDPRVHGTIAAVERDLVKDGLVRRYPGVGEVDGLPGGEGAFLACSFWYADSLCQVGRHDEAEELFERLLDLRNDVGLLAEEYDVRYGRLVGNIPQAYSHVALVNAAYTLQRRRDPQQARAGDGGAPVPEGGSPGGQPPGGQPPGGQPVGTAAGER